MKVAWMGALMGEKWADEKVDWKVVHWVVVKDGMKVAWMGALMGG